MALHVGNQIDDTIGITHFIIIPRNKLDKGLRKLNSSLGIKDGRSFISNKVSGNKVLVCVTKDALIAKVIKLSVTDKN